MTKIIATILLLSSSLCFAETKVEHLYLDKNPIALDVQYFSSNGDLKDSVVDFWRAEDVDDLINQAKKNNPIKIIVFHRKDGKVGAYIILPNEGKYRFKGWGKKKWSRWFAPRWVIL